MNKLFFLLLLISSLAKSNEFGPLRIHESNLEWIDTGGGLCFAPISGEEATEGMYVFRVKFPAGHKVSPHYHTDERVVTVLSGQLLVGYGKTFEEVQMIKLSAGSVFTEPKNQPHYVWSKEGEVIIQVVGSGNSKKIAID